MIVLAKIIFILLGKCVLCKNNYNAQNLPNRIKVKIEKPEKVFVMTTSTTTTDSGFDEDYNNNFTLLKSDEKFKDEVKIRRNSFRSNPNRLESFPLNMWYLFFAVIISLILIFLLNFALTNEIIKCNEDGSCLINKSACISQPIEKAYSALKFGGFRDMGLSLLDNAPNLEETEICYLCDKKVSTAHWNDGSHRRHCSTKKKSDLDRMPRPLEVTCPTCQTVLRLWPAHLGEGFVCNGPECKNPKEEVMYNSGYNRLNCFMCDYDICMTCANSMVSHKHNEIGAVRPNVSNTGLAARKWMIHMNPMVKQSLESVGSSKRSHLKRQDSRLSQAVMAAMGTMTCGGKIGNCATTCGGGGGGGGGGASSSGKKRKTSSQSRGSTGSGQVRSRSQSVKSAPYGARYHGSRSGSGIIGSRSGSGIIGSRSGSRKDLESGYGMIVSSSRSGSGIISSIKSQSRSSRINVAAPPEVVADVESGSGNLTCTSSGVGPGYREGPGGGQLLTVPPRPVNHRRRPRRPFRKAFSLEEDYSSNYLRQTVVKIEATSHISEDEESTADEPSMMLSVMSDVNPAKLYKLRTLSERNESCTE